MTLIYCPPYNKFWNKIADEMTQNSVENIKFKHKDPHLWELKHFQMYDHVFEVIMNNYPIFKKALFLGPLVRPEIFFSNIMYFYTINEDIKKVNITYLSMNEEEILNTELKKFVTESNITPVDYWTFLKQNTGGHKNAKE